MKQFIFNDKGNTTKYSRPNYFEFYSGNISDKIKIKIRNLKHFLILIGIGNRD